MKVHIFIGDFKSRKEATQYSEQYWEPEPDDTVTSEVYSEWEDNNPKWKMEEDLNCRLESDFIETITENKFEYIKGIIKTPEQINDLELVLNNKESVLILIYDKAISNLMQPLKTTDKINYHGTYLTNIQ